jgi:hypothetical protein
VPHSFYIYVEIERVKIFVGILLVWCILLTAPGDSYGQKQLVLLKKEKVILRLYPGDEIILRTKGSHTKMTSYVNNLSDTAVMLHQTIIPFYKIDRLYFKHSSFGNRFGAMMVVGGVTYFLVDQFNTIVVQGEEATWNKNVGNVSVAMVAIGLPLWLIKKKSQRIKPGYKLLTVEEGSPFYLPELQHMQF